MKIVLKKKNILLVIYAVFIVATASAVSSPVVYGLMEKILPYINICLIVLGFIITLIYNNAMDFFQIVLGSVLVFSIHLINGSSYGSIVSFLSLILGIIFFCDAPLDDDTSKIVSWLGIIYLIIALLKSGTFYESFLEGGYSINPNSICLFVAAFSVFVNMEFLNHKCWTFLYNFLALFVIVKYKSRTCLAAFIVFLLLMYVVPMKIWRNRKVALGTITLVFLGGIIFPLFYINAPSKLVMFITSITNKSFYSGREIMWGRFFASLINPKNLVFGPGSSQESVFTAISISGQQHVFSMHSSYLGIMLNFGLLGIIYLYYFLIKRILLVYRERVSEKQIISLIGLIMILIIGMAEVIFTYSYFVFFIAMIMTTLSSKQVTSTT